jgi:hypothetical protein
MDRKEHSNMDVTKTLLPGAPGTRRLLEKYGAALICVRYRKDRQTSRRVKTVELIVEDYAGPSPAPANLPRRNQSDTDVLLRIGYSESQLRVQVKAAGGRWLVERRLWQLPRDVAVRLNLMDRAVAAVD